MGKSTVINNLIKLFTKSPLTDIKGPVTIVTGKKRRITLIECNNDINSMIDIAKVADLVLLLCDASFGFEMEIFEFLNICQVHGMPRIMGILTHLDMIKNNKTLKNTKKLLKHRFWTEVYAGAKLFYLSGIVHGEYLRNEIKNLGRFISVIKFRPITWRSTHSYLLGDRIEDLTNQEFIRQNPKCDRNVSLYGYVRGVPLIKNTSVHVAGLGDLKIADVSYLPDPCPLPETIKKRALIEKEKLIYAPFSGVGGIVYDKDAVYVELGGSHSHKRVEEDETQNLMSNLIDTKETLDVKMEHSELQIFTGGKKLTAKDVKESNKEIKASYVSMRDTVDSDLDEELNELKNYNEEKIEQDGRTRRRVIFEQDDEDFSKTITSQDSDDESDSDEDIKTQPQYTVLKDNKDENIHLLVSGALQYLDKKNKKDLKSDSDNDSDTDESDNVAAIDNKSNKTSDESDNSDIDENIDKLDPEQESESEITMSKKSTTKKLNSSEKLKKTDEPDLDLSNLKENKLNRKTSDIDSDSDSDSDADINEKILNKNLEKNTSETSSSDSDEELDSESSEKLKPTKKLIEAEKSDSDDDDDNMGLKWKENLAKKARDAFLDRQKTTQNIMKLVYGVFDKHNFATEEVENKDREEIGGLFHLVTHEQRRLKEEKEKLNITESSLFNTWNLPTRNWTEEENKVFITNCFVTGKWKESEDAQEILKLDDMEISDDEIYGDFEDLETGEKHVSEKNSDKKRKRDTEEQEQEEKLDKEALREKKRKLKEKFDSEYDNGEKSTYYDDLKTSAEKQAQLNKSVFENMPDDIRVQIEGYRAGMYVRIEFENVPCEFITNFDPSYPLIIGALNMGEENIGYVNVKIKKHRWYKKILKTNDPLIISLGWRRFQTIPLFSKLEDDMKHRYVKFKNRQFEIIYVHIQGVV